MKAHGMEDSRLVELLQRVAQCDVPGRRHDSEAALRALYDITSGKLYGVALRVVGRRDWAEDVLQEAFLNIWRIAGDYRAAISPPMAWVGLIVRSRALDFLRRRASERADTAVELDETLAATIASEGETPMDTTLASEQAWALHECLRKLESRQRELLSLAYMRELTQTELAQRLQLPLGTVKTWMRRGLEQLRVCMGRHA